MIVQTKPLKTKLKHTQNPLEDFMSMKYRHHHSTMQEVLFIRYIGIPDSIKLYLDQLLQIDQYFSNTPSSRYIRLQGLEKLAKLDDINRLAKIWEDWQTSVNASSSNPYAQYQASLCTRLADDTLEWTKKLVFLEIMSIYKKSYPNSNETTLKNFALKFLYWIDLYFPLLFDSTKDTTISPKVIFIGDIKHHELLFLYFLSKLGCDICYMNPKEDVVQVFPEIEKFSTLYKCTTLYSDKMNIPDFLSSSNRTHQNANERVSRSEIPHPSNYKVEKPVGELSYENLASQANSVVMIKTLDSENKPICFGSGVVIHQEGYILTNFHVVEGGHYFSVLYENETEEYVTDYLIKYHQAYDLAVIKVDRKSSPLIVKKEGNLVRGQKIVAIGSPLGLFNSVSDGIVSGFREINTIPMIQFTAPISDGSSGGALIDMYGRLVGIITAGFDKGQNLNLAVPSQKIYEFAHNFIEHAD